jgi:hypothetical protein
MLELSDAAHKELEAYFADKKSYHTNICSLAVVDCNLP